MPTVSINGRSEIVPVKDPNDPVIPLNKAYLPSEIATRLRAMGYGSFTGWLPNPDEILRKTGNGIAEYKNLLSDSHVGGAAEGRKSATLSLKWMVSREGVSENSVTAAIVAGAIEQLNIRQIITDILNAPFFGYQPLEVLWKIDDFQWAVPISVTGKPPEWFVYDQDNSLRFLGMFSGDINGELVPPRKFLVARHGADYENPYGTPILSRVFWPVQFKRGSLKYWVEFLEKFGGPWILAHYPEGMEQKDIDALVDSLNLMARNGILALPNNVQCEISVVATGSSATGLYREFIDTANAEISKAIVGHTGGVESTPGKLGSEDAALGVRSDIILSDKELVTDIFNQLIDWIYELNFPAESERVRFVLYPEENIDSELASRDKILFDMGVTFTKEHYVNAYDLSPDEFEIGDPPKPEPMFAELPDGATPGGGVVLTPTQEALDRLPGMLSPEVQQSLMTTLAAPLIAIVEGSTSYADAMDKIATAFPAMASGEIEAVYERMLFVADIMARTEEQSESDTGDNP